MNTYPSNIQDLDSKRHQLEQLWQPATPSQKLRRAASNWLSTAGQWLVQTLTAGHQPHIWTRNTPQGTHWCVRQPGEDTVHTFDSETAVREWLEQRYYR